MNPNASITDAFALASSSGRGGLGMPIFMASGNEAASGTTVVQYPAKLSTVIAVGASTGTDARAPYSEYGPELDIVAPSSSTTNTADLSTLHGVWTTDRADTAGFNPKASKDGGDYLGFFNGTSAATPLAAGVAALLLSYNPNLTGTNVRDQILNNAYTNISGVTFTSHFNPEYGYGRLDASAAFNGVTHHTTAPSVSNVTLSNDDGGLTTKNTSPVLTFTFSERPVWSPGDITVTGPGSVAVNNFTVKGMGTTSIELDMPTLSTLGDYTVKFKGGRCDAFPRPGRKLSGKRLQHDVSPDCRRQPPEYAKFHCFAVAGRYQQCALFFHANGSHHQGKDAYV
jgi:subtilisin family serine protease